MLVGRVVGYMFMLAALAILGRDCFAWYDTGAFVPIRFGELWGVLHNRSYLGFGELVRDYLPGWVWSPVLSTLFAIQAFALAAILGIALAWIFRTREPKTPGRMR